MKYRLSKKLVYKIIENEINENGVKVNVLPVSNIENIKEIIRQEIKEKIDNKDINILEMLVEIIANLKFEIIEQNLGFYDSEKHKIKILLTNIKNRSDNKKEFFYNILDTIYHEYNHAILYEDLIQKDNLIKYKLELDWILWDISNYYETNNYDFYQEILAYNYSNEKAMKFIERYPKAYQFLKSDIKKLKYLHQIYLQNYDPQQFINRISKIIKMKDIKTKNQEFKKNELLAKLFKKDGSPKLQKDLSQEGIYIIISSRAYLDIIDYGTQKKETLYIILEALNYTYNIEQIRTEQNKNLRNEIMDNPLYDIDLLSLLDKKQKRVEKKLNYLELQIEKINLILNNKTDNKKMIRKLNA